MNFINMMEILKNQINFDTYRILYDDFMESYSAEYRKLRPCKSVSDRAIKKYISGVRYKDDNNTGIYTDGVTILMIGHDIQDAEKNTTSKNLRELITGMWKNKKPVDCYFMDSIALYKAMKKQEDKKYLLCIDGHYYDAALITQMMECIATSKEQYIRAEICENGALLIQQKYMAMILPVNTKTCHPSANINSQDFLKCCASIENSYFKDILKTA